MRTPYIRDELRSAGKTPSPAASQAQQVMIYVEVSKSELANHEVSTLGSEFEFRHKRRPR